jgi:hypothetical protein
MISFEISESDYSKKLTSHYELSILCRVDSFVYMATDDQRRVLLLRDYRLDTPFPKFNQRAEELRHTFSKDTNLQVPFRNVRIGVVTERHTLVPNRLYNPQEKTAYLRQLTPLTGEWEVKSDDLNSIAAQNVYAYPVLLMEVFAEQFSRVRFCHCGSAFLLAHHAMTDFQKGKQVFVNVWSSQVQVILYEGGELQFINTYPYQSFKDFIYFVMLVFDQYDLDRQRVPLHLAGQITEGSEIFRLLKRYVQQVNMQRAPAFVQLGKDYGQVPQHLYYDLFCLLQCH